MVANASNTGTPVLFSASCLCVKAANIHTMGWLFASLNLCFCYLSAKVWYSVNSIFYCLQGQQSKSKLSSWSGLLLYNHPLIFLFTFSVDSLADTFYSIGLVMRLCQLLSVLEILHILIGIDKSRFFPRFLQVCPFLKTLLPKRTHFSHSWPWGQAQVELPCMVHLHLSSGSLVLPLVC